MLHMYFGADFCYSHKIMGLAHIKNEMSIYQLGKHNDNIRENRLVQKITLLYFS